MDKYWQSPRCINPTARKVMTIAVCAQYNKHRWQKASSWVERTENRAGRMLDVKRRRHERNNQSVRWMRSEEEAFLSRPVRWMRNLSPAPSSITRLVHECQAWLCLGRILATLTPAAAFPYSLLRRVSDWIFIDCKVRDNKTPFYLSVCRAV